MACMSIAIDGLSKCGKSTLAKRLAKEFDMLYIDSGALYRFAAYMLKDNSSVNELSLEFFDDVEMDSDGNILFHNRSYVNEIGSDAVNNSVSVIAQNPLVRDAVNDWIRKTASYRSVSIDGRDIGTVVLPDATIKLYLYSSVEYRTECWRKRQLSLFGYIDPVLEKKEIENIKIRDYNDLHRAVAPLRCAADALKFDVEQTPHEKVFQIVRNLILAVM